MNFMHPHNIKFTSNNSDDSKSIFEFIFFSLIVHVNGRGSSYVFIHCMEIYREREIRCWQCQLNNYRDVDVIYIG